ncbi:Integrin linked protein kinase [Paragonimus heterotremus]|uniref:Integrin linked protein kinase n=1 Tax=Paragonimus heterotremus TaxID=100268 RepID=A0A8J4TF56_9TREM|nr:Integrin linked protein kinase [Paragonimus heterotremus]
MLLTLYLLIPVGPMETIIAHVREGNLQEVRPWLDDIENDVNQGDEHRFSLLHWAAREGQLAVVDLLVMRGARVNATNMGDDTALHLAASHGHIDVVHFLLNCHRFNVDVPNEHGNTPLHYACFWNHLEISEYLIKQGASLMQENKYGETPLEIARPRAAALLAPLAEALGHDLSHRKPFRDTSWLGTKTRARDATLYRLDGESWDPREVELTGALSDGHGAEVLKGSFRRCPVVVKMLKLRNCTIRQARDFKEEFPRLRIFNHPNILPVLAIFTATPRLCLVSDYMQYGSLYDVLHQPVETSTDGTVGTMDISHRQALRFAVDIAKAMEFLHSPELKVPNFRLNSKHVMIDEDIAKLGISDFDSKENADDTHAYRDELLIARLDMADYKFSFHEKAREYNPAWMSPEALSKKSSEINLEACDMWSFGVVLWELLTRMIPFGGMNPMVIGMQITTENLRLPIPTHLDPRVSRLIELCMKEDPGKRPRFDAQLIQLLDKMRERASQ